jgi:hypothetical protein
MNDMKIKLVPVVFARERIAEYECTHVSRRPLHSAMKFAVTGLAGCLLATGALAQSSRPVKVSNAIEGGRGGVSVARCGDSVVAGFGDQEAAPANSFDGYAVSKNGSKSFNDLGVLPVGSPNDPQHSNQTLGNFSNTKPGSEALACSSPNLFYAASRYGYAGPGGDPFTNIAISTSLNGGTKWSLPQIASSGAADIYNFFMPSIAVDPTNAQQLYIAYINLNTGGPDTPDCSFGSTILEFVHSSDGGKTWDGRSDPAIQGRPDMQLDHTCQDGPAFAISGPIVTVAADGAVYIAYEFQGNADGAGAALHEIRFVRSLDHGQTFSAPTVISSDAIYDNPPQIAVDRSSSSRRGEIYVTWPGSPSGSGSEILASESVDGGVSFSFPAPISAGPSGSALTQVNPALATDASGMVAACFDQTPSNTPDTNSVYSHLCATSFNNGASWQVQAIDSAVISDVEGLASDFLLRSSGFFTGYRKTSSGQPFVFGEAF